VTHYSIGEERDGSFEGWREWPFLIDGDERGKVEYTGKGYRADVTYTGVERLSLRLAVADGERQAEAKRGQFSGTGVNVEVRALAATDTKPSRLAVIAGDGTRTEVPWDHSYEGIRLAETAVRRMMPDAEPVYIKGTKDGWLFRI
jgi:hypothetical protein